MVVWDWGGGGGGGLGFRVANLRELRVPPPVHLTHSHFLDSPRKDGTHRLPQYPLMKEYSLNHIKDSTII